MRIALTDHSSQEEVLRAIRDLPYEGRSRRTGEALVFLVHRVFSPVISRDHGPKVWRREVTATAELGSTCLHYVLVRRTSGEHQENIKSGYSESQTPQKQTEEPPVGL